MTIDVTEPKQGRALIMPRDGFQVSQLSEWTNTLPTKRRGLNIVAAIVLVTTFGLGGVWAGTARIGGAIPGGGRVIAAGTNQVVQHLEGGIIRSILVNEGDTVVAGQQLATLDPTNWQSQLDATQVQQAMATIELQRWRSANQNLDTFEVDLSPFGDAINDPRVQETLESQRSEFTASRDVVIRQLAQLDATIANEREDISYLAELTTATQSQFDIVSQELADMQNLLDDGLTTRNRVTTLERTIAQLTAQLADAKFTVNKSEHNIASAEQEKEGLLLKGIEEANQNITRVQGQLNQLKDVEIRVQDRLSRISLVAPVDGVVFKINYKSVGAVLPAGQTFFEIFPEGEALAIETLLLPKDIAEVAVGQEVDVVFASDHRTVLTPLAGIVDYVSTDTTVNQNTGQSFYIVRTRVEAGQEERTILPGNTAEVFFKTTPKTLFEYAMEPITRFAFRSFKG